MPRISIITPTHNRPGMIGRAIESVLRQTHTDWEMIIADDCPDKPVEAIVREYNDPRITYIKHEKNQGGGAARNTAMKASKGDFFCFIDDDDEWFPNALEILLGGIEGTPPEVGFCYATMEYKYPDGTIVTAHVPPGIADQHERALQIFSGFIGQGLIVKRAVYDNVGGWDPSLPSHQEIEWVIRITKSFSGKGIDTPIMQIPIGVNYLHIGNDFPRRIRGRELLLERYKTEFEQHPDIYAKHLFLLAMWHRSAGNFTAARRVMGRVVGLRPTLRHFAHYAILCLNGFLYRVFMRSGLLHDFIDNNEKNVGSK